MTTNLLEKKCIILTEEDVMEHFFVQSKPNSNKLHAIFNGKPANFSQSFLPTSPFLVPLLSSLSSVLANTYFSTTQMWKR
jgi:hypothetical protein